MPNDAVRVIVSSKYLSYQKITMNTSRVSNSNTVLHSVDISYAQIRLLASFKAYINLSIS